MLRALRLLCPAALLLAATPPGSAADPPQGKPQHTNRLARETSPYLLLHAHNPVDWYPWGEEALAKAKKEKKLIFLSVGYSSCYWCHVMERQSFMDEEIAKYLNEHYVCIKVDREERPDVDEIYMTSLQVYNQLIGSQQGGGWPLSMFLTPDAQPIGGGTYFPPRAEKERGLPGFLDVIKQVAGMWAKDPDRLEQSAGQIATFVKEQLRRRPPLVATPPGAGVLKELLAELAEDYDAKYGGFGYSAGNPAMPKFPEPSNLVFLLDRIRRGDDAQARRMLLGTLDRMAAGGIRDHLGGGFHRYSTDRFWRIPHFEKMLYDNGQLASVYAEAYALTGREDYRRVVDELLGFVLREMTAEEGAFYSALDAETDAHEGRFYVWTTEELKAALGDDYALLADAYGAAGEPNFVDPHAENPQEDARYVLLLPRPLEATAEKHGLTLAQLEVKLAAARQKLLAVRNRRQRPLTDTKILTGWNGLMIRGLADAGRLLKEEKYTQAAARAADFVLAKLRTKEGRLLRTYGGGVAKLNAYLDDYANLIDGLIALHRATGQRRWLREADALQTKQIELFWDKEGGGFYFTSEDHESLIARSKGPVDGARPAGNSVSAANLVYLGKALDKPQYLKRADETIQTYARLLDQTPAALPRMATALAALLELQPRNK